MGQYWRFIAPGKWQCLRWHSEFKMPEFVYESETSQWLTTLLIVRDTVKGQPSEHLAPPTSRVYGASKASKSLASSGPKRTDNAQEPSRLSSDQSSPASPLLSLPLELQIMIIQQLPNPDKITLGVTCAHLWHFAIKEVEASLLSNPAKGPWAGVPLVFVGDYTNADEYPPEIDRLTKEGLLGAASGQESRESSDYFDEFVAHYQGMLEQEFVTYHKPMLDAVLEQDLDYRDTFTPSSQGSVSNEDEDEDEDEDANSSLAVSMSYMDKRYNNIKPWHCTNQFESLRKHYLEVSGASTAKLFDSVITPDNFIPTDRPWILRNLITRQFIRQESVAFNDCEVRGPCIKRRGFGHVLAMRTGWSQDPSISMDDETTHGLTTGPWAGHCFDIVSLRMHEEQVLADEEHVKAWEDISAEIKDELDRVWRR